ncbi:MAG: F0F1 ATP synthase subunit A [Sciscionella sp.]
MTEHVLAQGTIEVGSHPQWVIFGLTLNADTIIGTLCAAALVVALGFFVRRKVTSGVPNGAQLFFESVTKFFRDQIESIVGVRTAPYLVPLGMALFVFILACNWWVLLPLHEYVPPPTSDVNLAYSLAVLVFVWWHAAGTRRHRGPGKHFIHVARGHYPPFAPLWLLEELIHLISLPLRLFGNILAGTIMLSLFSLLPAYVLWLPDAGWKLFDMFVGLIQALIFVLLTVVYFAEALGTTSQGDESS